MKRHRLLLVAALLALPRVAFANPWDLYGFNARAIGMGGAQTATFDDFTGVHYNPAGLTIASEPSFGFGFNLARPSLTLDFDNANRSIADLAPPSSNGVTFGALFPMGGARWRNRVVAALAINVPTSSLLDGQALDPATPHWYMYQALPRRIVASLGLGVMPLDWLSLGLGVQILAGVEGSLDFELDVVAGRFSQKAITFDIVPRAAPLAGIEVRPIEGFRFGVAYRASIQSDVDLPVDLDITALADLSVTNVFNVQYTPHQFAFGASYEVKPADLTIAVDLVWAMWSQAPDPSVDSRIDVGGDLFEGTGLDGALDAPAPGQERSVDLGFRDVLVAHFGAEYALGAFRFRGGYAVRPSPAPSQTTGTNYVDATTHQFSIGAGVRLYDPFDVLANPLILDAAGAYHFVPSRRYEKVDARDPVGAYTASGSIFVAGISLRYEFGEAPVADPPSPILPKPAPAPEATPLPDVEPAPEPLPEGDGE